MTEIISLTIKKELKDQIDLLRAGIPRSKFITRMLENSLQKSDQDNNKD